MIQPLKWWGGKHYLAKKIIGLMPRHLHYVEPYAGGLAVLLEKDPFDRSKFWGNKGYEQGVSEVVNDIHRELTNFWQVLQREETFAAFRRLIEVTPFSQVEWENAEARQHPSRIWMSKPPWRSSSGADRAGQADSRISPPFPGIAPGGR